ncbi:MAG: cysteine-rich CWC family protein [Nitrososphaerales archaeon]|jgi:hypothetical protein
MAKEIACGVCGKSFVCGEGLGCWCGSIVVSKEELQAIKDRVGGDGCVCQDCLVGRGRPSRAADEGA